MIASLISLVWIKFLAFVYKLYTIIYMCRAIQFFAVIFSVLASVFPVGAREWTEKLSADESVEFCLISPLRGEVRLEVVPELRSELTAKLNELARLENLRLRRHTEGYKRVPTRLTPFHTWELCCRVPGQEEPTKGFLMRGRSWVGGFTENEFNAARYFTADSWKAAWDKLTIPEVDDADRLAGYAERTEDAWPDAGAIAEVWTLPENLSPEDDITFYIKDEYNDELAVVEITPLPELRAEFIAKLNKLSYLSKRCSGAKFGSQCNRLYCRTTEISYGEGFALRADTWVGDICGNEFNAARYFSPEDWARVEEAFGKTKLRHFIVDNPYADYQDKTEDTWLEPDKDESDEKYHFGKTFTMQDSLPPALLSVASKIGKGSVELQTLPDKDEVLRAQLMCLRRLEAEVQEFSRSRFHVPVCQTYALFYRPEAYGSYSELFLWDTHIGGGFCGYWFDAARYITPASWVELRTKLGSEYDRVGYTTPFDPAMPGAEPPSVPEANKMPQSLSPSENITFFMSSDYTCSNSRGVVVVELVPELREEFIRKLNRLGKLDNRFRAWMRAQSGWVHTIPPPSLSYRLHCYTDEACYDGFELICRTWIGGLNAERYITPRSWEEVQAKLRTMSDEAEDAENSPPDEEDDSPAGPLSMSVYSNGEGGNPTAWCEWVQDTAKITLELKTGKSTTLSPDDRRAVLTLATAVDPITRKNVSSLAFLKYLLQKVMDNLQPEEKNKPTPQDEEDAVIICFIDADGDCITTLNWAHFHPQRDYHKVLSGYLMADEAYDELDRRLQAAISKAEAGE